MAGSQGRSSRGRGRDKSSEGNGGNGGDTTPPIRLGTPNTTGRYLVLLREGELRSGVELLGSSVGLQVASASDFGASAVPSETLAESEAIVFDTLGIAVVSTPPDQFERLSAAAAGDTPILAIEEERVVYALADELVDRPPVALPAPLPLEATSGFALATYLRGYQDAVNHLVEKLLAESGAETVGIPGAGGVLADGDLTWGLLATNVGASRYTGKGVRVAVLDTGFDLGHPDFIGRLVVARSFIKGESAQDGHGHGTHCIGTACGPLRPNQLPRYGIASEAEIYVGKVLSNQGSGSDGGILAGIEWAITNRCAVISMSLGAPAEVGQPFSRIFETAARRALAAGALIVAAAGNESRRPSLISPVGHPANCPSIMSVAAVDAQLGVASFSSGGLSLQGGQVDIAGPGVAVRSSWPRPTLYRSISGTSMATPHVAGIAALYAQANPDVRGGALGWLLLQSARRLILPARDVGAGLVQAPQLPPPGA